MKGRPPGPLDMWRCWACWGELIRSWNGQQAHTFCINRCNPEGYIKRSTVEHRKAQAEIEYLRVIAEYPELDPHKNQFADVDIEDVKEALFG